MNWMTEKENILLKLENQKLNEDIRELNRRIKSLEKGLTSALRKNSHAINYIKTHKRYEAETSRDTFGNLEIIRIESPLVNGSKVLEILQGSDSK